MQVFKHPPSSRDVGYVSKERADVEEYKNARGDPAGASRKVSSFIFISRPPNSFFVSTGASQSRRNKSLRRPHPPSLTTTVPSKLRPYDWWNAPPHPRLPTLSLRELVSSSACIRWGDMSLWVVRTLAHLQLEELTPSFARNPCASVKPNTAAARSLYDEHPPPC